MMLSPRLFSQGVTKTQLGPYQFKEVQEKVEKGNKTYMVRHLFDTRGGSETPIEMPKRVARKMKTVSSTRVNSDGTLTRLFIYYSNGKKDFQAIFEEGSDGKWKFDHRKRGWEK